MRLILTFLGPLNFLPPHFILHLTSSDTTQYHGPIPQKCLCVYLLFFLCPCLALFVLWRFGIDGTDLEWDACADTRI